MVKDHLWDERMGLAEPGRSWSKHLLPASWWDHRAAPALRGESSPERAADRLQNPSRLQPEGYSHSTLGNLSQMQHPCLQLPSLAGPVHHNPPQKIITRFGALFKRRAQRLPPFPALCSAVFPWKCFRRLSLWKSSLNFYGFCSLFFSRILFFFFKKGRKSDKEGMS